MKRVLRKDHTRDVGKFLAGVISGFSFFVLASHPEKSPIRKLPEKRVRNVSYFPNIKIQKGKGHYHIHHWMIFSALYAPFILIRRLRSKFFHGLIIGSIFQGLTYKDRFRIKYRSDSIS